MTTDRIASALGLSEPSPLQRRLLTSGIVVLVALLVLGAGWLWIWPTRGIGAFTTDITAKRQLAMTTLNRVLGPADSGDVTSTEPFDMAAARRAYKLDRLRLGDFLCLDGCPTWYPGDHVEATRTQTVDGQAAPCAYWLGQVHPHGITLRPRPLRTGEHTDICGYLATTRGVEIELIVMPDQTGTVSLRWTARVS